MKSNVRPRIIFVILMALIIGPIEGISEEAPCLPKTTQDVLQCVLRNHPDVGQATLASQRDSALQKVARQRINPETETKIVAGGGDRLDTETSLLHTLEVGGKRGARIKQAAAQKTTAEVNLLKTQEEAALQTVLTLNRLRQIRDESHILGESLHIYQQLVAQLKKRPRRTPEQEVSLAVFELAQAETLLKRTELTQEEEALITWMEWATGLDSTQFRKLLPGAKKNWPKMEPAPTGKTLNSSEVKKALAELKEAEAERKLANAKAWPDLSLGPTVESEKQGDDTRFVYGGRLIIPLPILSQNRGERKFSTLEVRRAEHNYASVQIKTALEREKQTERYRLALRALRQTRSAGSLNKTHQDIDARVEQGFIPSSLVIEAHRQILEMAKGRHEQELTAIDALWRIAIIDGRIWNERI